MNFSPCLYLRLTVLSAIIVLLGCFFPSISMGGDLQSIDPSLIRQLPPELQQQLAAKVLAARANEKKTALEPLGAVGEEAGGQNKNKPVFLKPAGLHKKQVKAIQESRLERIYKNRYSYKGVYPISPAPLFQFGYDLFNTASVTPSDLAVPDSNYVLGPGDELSIKIWGSAQGTEFYGTIDRDGTITIPKIGVVAVAGITLGKVKSVLRHEAEKYIQGINLSVTLAKLRSVEVYVVGRVNSPGLHLVPAFSTVLAGLLAGGGIPKNGSLRHVQLLRAGEKPRTIDLYELILHGSRKSDCILKDRDVIFVPRIGNTVAVAGAVAQPGIFELSGEKSLGDIISLAGGILPQAFAARIYVRRFKDNAIFTVCDIAGSAGQSAWKSTPIQKGDFVGVQFAPTKQPLAVTLEGHVWRPDIFDYHPGLMLSSILTSPDLLKPGAITDFALLYRYDTNSTRYSVQRFDLKGVFAGTVDMPLRAYDKIKILSRKEVGIVEQVRIAGAVWNPGTYNFLPRMTLADLVSLAGGRKIGANTDRIEISRQHITANQVKNIQTTYSLASQGGTPLVANDYVFVPMVKGANVIKTVSITGEVRFPGTYAITDKERISDLITRAGGMTPQAYFYGAEFTSLSAKTIQQKSLNDMIQELEIRSQQALATQSQTALSKEDAAIAKDSQQGIQGFINKLKEIHAQGRVSFILSDLQTFRGSENDFLLHDGDALFIPKRPIFIAVMGSVYSPNAYLYKPQLRVADYLKMSGGSTKSADDDYRYILKANGEILSCKQVGYRNFKKTRLMPGDTIVVPENMERVPYLKLVKDISDIIFKIAATAGIAIRVF